MAILIVTRLIQTRHVYAIAQKHEYNVEALATYLQTKKRPEGQHVVDLDAMRESTEHSAAAEANKPCR